MTKEQTQRMIEVMQAWLKGKTIQLKAKQGDTCWTDLYSEPDFRVKDIEWRIKPQTIREYVPFDIDDNLIGLTIMPRDNTSRDNTSKKGYTKLTITAQGICGVCAGIFEFTYRDLYNDYLLGVDIEGAHQTCGKFRDKEDV
jgi:hypothetical protein